MDKYTNNALVEEMDEIICVLNNRGLAKMEKIEFPLSL